MLASNPFITGRDFSLHKLQPKGLHANPTILEK